MNLKFQRRLGSVLFLTAFILVTFTRCGTQNTGSTIPTSGTFASVYSIIKSNSCNQCHIPTGAATVNSNVALDFTSSTTAYTTLTTKLVTGTVASGTCGTVKIVGATPSKSYLSGILFTDYAGSNFAGVTGCTPVTTHTAMFNLSATNEASINAWITAGALNN
jgi:hypothetical protein